MLWLDGDRQTARPRDPSDRRRYMPGGRELVRNVCYALLPPPDGMLELKKRVACGLRLLRVARRTDRHDAGIKLLEPDSLPL